MYSYQLEKPEGRRNKNMMIRRFVDNTVESSSSDKPTFQRSNDEDFRSVINDCCDTDASDSDWMTLDPSYSEMETDRTYSDYGSSEPASQYTSSDSKRKTKMNKVSKQRSIDIDSFGITMAEKPMFLQDFESDDDTTSIHRVMERRKNYDNLSSTMCESFDHEQSERTMFVVWNDILPSIQALIDNAIYSNNDIFRHVLDEKLGSKLIRDWSEFKHIMSWKIRHSVLYSSMNIDRF